jgi:hypothetical protein
VTQQRLLLRTSLRSAVRADPGESTIRPDRTTLAAFATFVTLAGGNVIAVRSVSCEDCELDPFWAAASRFLLASLILAAIALVVRGGMPHGRALLGALLYGVLIGVYVGTLRRPAVAPDLEPGRVASEP